MSNIEYQNFESLFSDKLRERGLTLKKLSELTNIATGHLENLGSGRFENLPAAPYVYGYLRRLGPVLGFDPEEWWERLKEDGAVKTSGLGDELPKNRFAIQSRAWFIWAAFLGVVLLIYLGVRLPEIVGEPIIRVTYPAENPATVSEETITITGTLQNGDSLSVNGESVEVGAEGAWRKEISLQRGLNSVVISSKKFLGKEARALRQVIYEPAESGAFPPR